MKVEFECENGEWNPNPNGDAKKKIIIPRVSNRADHRQITSEKHREIQIYLQTMEITNRIVLLPQPLRLSPPKLILLLVVSNVPNQVQKSHHRSYRLPWGSPQIPSLLSHPFSTVPQPLHLRLLLHSFFKRIGLD